MQAADVAADFAHAARVAALMNQVPASWFSDATTLLHTKGCGAFADKLLPHAEKRAPFSLVGVTGLKVVLVAPSDNAIIVEDLPKQNGHLKQLASAHVLYFSASSSTPISVRSILPDEDSPTPTLQRRAGMLMADGSWQGVEPQDATELEHITHIGGAKVNSRHPLANGVGTILCVGSMLMSLSMDNHSEFRPEQVGGKEARAPVPAPSFTVLGAGPTTALDVKARLCGEVTQEQIRCRPEPDEAATRDFNGRQMKEREVFGYCPDLRSKAKAASADSKEPVRQVLHDTHPVLTVDGPTGGDISGTIYTSRLFLPPASADDRGVRRLPWFKGQGANTACFLKIGVHPCVHCCPHPKLLAAHPRLACSLLSARVLLSARAPSPWHSLLLFASLTHPPGFSPCTLARTSSVQQPAEEDQ